MYPVKRRPVRTQRAITGVQQLSTWKPTFDAILLKYSLIYCEEFVKTGPPDYAIYTPDAAATCPKSCSNINDMCCWICVSCREDAYVFNDTCKSCEPGWGPNALRNGCVKLEALVIEWLNPWAIVPLTFSTFGILCTLFTTCVFIRYNRTPVIMASGRELCYVLLFGILSCYAMSFVILAKPTVQTCAIMRIGLGLCLSICYSAIFTKTNRISRIFNRGVKSIKRPVYTSPISQVAIAIGMDMIAEYKKVSVE